MKPFHQDCVRKLRENPPSSSAVMIATVAVTVATHDLAQGVLVGVSRTHSWDITAVIAREVKARDIDMLLMGASAH